MPLRYRSASDKYPGALMAVGSEKAAVCRYSLRAMTHLGVYARCAGKGEMVTCCTAAQGIIDAARRQGRRAMPVFGWQLAQLPARLRQGDRRSHCHIERPHALANRNADPFVG